MDEREIMESVEQGEWTSVGDKSELFESIEGAARATMLKDQRMNIRISQRDLYQLKTRAVQEGIPYQTLVTSIIHKYLSGMLKEHRC